MKFILIPILILIACCMAGIFGILHDQLTYTISPEYFHKFKFIQFQIGETLQTRSGVTIVGFLSTWWMGLIISIALTLTGLFCKNRFFLNILTSYLIVLTTTFIIGLIALSYGYLFIHQNTIPNLQYPEGLTDKVSFARVGIMHTISYLGGFIGLIIGMTYLLRKCNKMRA